MKIERGHTIRGKNHGASLEQMAICIFWRFERDAL